MEDPLQVLRIAVSAALIFAFVWLAALNWYAFWTAIVRRQRAPSWIPLLAGMLGSTGVLLAPLPGVSWLWWLPFLLDWGSAPGLLHAGVYHALARIRGRAA